MIRVGLSRHTAFRVIAKLTAFVCLAFVILNSTSVTHGQTTLSATVSSMQLKLRATPNLKGQILTYLGRNEPVTVDGRNRALSWVHIYHSSGFTGWVYRYYLKFPRGTNLRQLPIMDGNGTSTTGQAPSPITASFTSQSQYLDQSGKVTVQWSVQGNPFAGIEVRLNGSSEWHGVADLAPNGSLTIDLKPYITAQTGAIYFADFWLHYGNDSNGQALWKYLHLDCPPSMFFRSTSDPMICPLNPAQSVQSAYEPFEHGFMIWRGDLKEFYVFDTSSNSMVYSGTGITTPNQPIDPKQIPSGLYQPVSGFGRIWDNMGWIRQDLGWATAVESGYTATIRETPLSPLTPYNWQNRVVMTLPNGRVITFTRNSYSGWSYVE